MNAKRCKAIRQLLRRLGTDPTNEQYTHENVRDHVASKVIEFTPKGFPLFEPYTHRTYTARLAGGCGRNLYQSVKRSIP